MFRLDEMQQADVLLFIQELMEQAVAVVSRRSDTLNRRQGLR